MLSTAASKSQCHIVGPLSEPCCSPAGSLAQQGVLHRLQLIGVLRLGFSQAVGIPRIVGIFYVLDTFTCRAQGLQTSFISPNSSKILQSARELGCLPESITHDACPTPACLSESLGNQEDFAGPARLLSFLLLTLYGLCSCP